LKGFRVRENWDFSLAPLYLWGVSISGEQTVKGIDVDVDVPFSDIFNNLNGAFTIHFEGVHQQRWGFLVDFSWIRLNPKQETPFGDIDITYTDILTELGGFYRWNRGAHNFDALGGLRYSSMDVDLDFPGPLPKIDQSKGWLDPFVGGRWAWQISDKWNLRLRGDIGGFGVGSDFSWNLVGLIEFQPWKYVALFAGYRALYQDYEDGNGRNKFKFDATMHGPGIGLNIKW
jgi:hypothetical protein